MTKKEEPIYQDEQLKIEFHASEEYFVCLKDKTGEETGYFLPRGVLQELALTKRGGIERKLFNSNERLLHAIKEEGISIDSLHVALCQAYAEDERRRNEYMMKQRT